jgi:tetratricopeptide (TPR) repeat protein
MVMDSSRKHTHKSWLVLIFLPLILIATCFGRSWAVGELTLEVQPKSPGAIITLQTQEIEEIGINERLGGILVVIKLPSRYHQKLRQMTQENIGKKLNIRLDGETLVTGTIHTPLETGKFVLESSSVEEARQTILDFGREPDYHLKFTPEEIEAAKVYTEPAKNPWFGKAVYAELDGDYVKAEEYTKKAIESDPNEPGFHQHLGYLYYVQGKKEIALEEFLTAERLDEENVLRKFPGTYLSIAEAYTSLNEYDSALEYLKKVFVTYPDNPSGHLQLAVIYEKMGENDLALKEYLKLLEDGYFQQEATEAIRRLKAGQSEPVK